MERDDMLGRLQRGMGENFFSDRALATVSRKENGEQQVGQLVKRIEEADYGKTGRPFISTREVGTANLCYGFCEELKKYKDTVDCGEGMAKLFIMDLLGGFV